MPMDHKKYPKDWKKISIRIRERAGDHCEICGARNHAMIMRWRKNPARFQYVDDIARGPEDRIKMRVGIWDTQWAPSIKVILTVAHLDHDEDNPHPDPKRLKALCQRCHLGHDREDNLRRRQMKRMIEDSAATGQGLMDI